ncbi:MAG TPA: dihydrodipicolinate reductase C-terminal domain-containing protein, partial [Gammaproteobacteria bacterium]
AHHRHKVDAPSGTALALGEVLAAVRGKPLAALADHGRSGRTGSRQPGRIGFHAIRAGEIAGEHDVRLISAGEKIRLGHTAFGRDAFATGALRAAAWLHGRSPGFFGMHDLLQG